MAAVAETVTSTNTFEVKEVKEGTFEVKQIAPEKPSVELNSGNRKEFSWGVGPFEVHGYYDPDTETIGAYPSFAGAQIGSGYSASLQSGLTITIVLLAYNGGARFFRNGNKLRVEVNLSPLLPWGDDISGGADLFDI